MAQSLLAIATFVALIGGVIFGVSRYEKSTTRREDSIGQVIQSIPELKIDPEPIPVVPVAEEISTPAEVSAPIVEAIDEAPEPTEEAPIAELSLEAESTETLKVEEMVAEAPIDDAPEPRGEVVEVVLPPTIQDSKRPEDEVEPREQVVSVLVPPTIHDPKRPNDGKLEDLTQDLLAWGQSKDLKHISKLVQYTTYAEPLVRGTAVVALGQIVRHHAVRGEVEQAIPVLGKLTLDSDLKVRLYAVQALGRIRSEKVLPYLEKALQSPSGSVVKAANGAIQDLKLQYGKTPAMQVAQKMLERTKKTSV
ncbi:HEAT repeat domain-containing protein [Leptolyngbya sp. FACHB-17]|uniref:HEAT repeat domain-containing protein n=1 Tax=unclassified Leptolyngbya TaxID=2650499 RepID=UPI00168113B4|nr:HEAT repeat domain-containing protein [Leptolyngbya sp. FACHB-17]MBD2080464.1 HEAT repeat domain-containing protein [Leptolyngbya sp. FACHB-17]